MSFTKTKELSYKTSYPDLSLDISEGTKVVEVTYTAINILSLDLSGNCQAQFKVEVEGSEGVGFYTHFFSYSGEGNPFEQAENSLSNS